MPKKRQPYNPAKATKDKFKGHLGVPDERRAAKSSAGFDTEAIADGRYCSRERAMLTHPGLLRERYNAIVRKHEESGEPLPDRIQDNRTTPSDRVTAQHRNVLWSYIRIRTEVLQGEMKGVNYGGAPAPRDLNRVPLSDGQFDARRWYSWVRGQVGLLPVTDFIDQIVFQIYPELTDDGAAAPTKEDIGRDLTGTQNDRDAKNAVDGALALACRSLADAARDFVIMERSHKDELKRLAKKAIN